jgi:hypothetical protein
VREGEGTGKKMGGARTRGGRAVDGERACLLALGATWVWGGGRLARPCHSNPFLSVFYVLLL